MITSGCGFGCRTEAERSNVNEEFPLLQEEDIVSSMMSITFSLRSVHLSKIFISHFCVQPSNFCCSLSFFNVFKHIVWTLINIFINIKYHNQVIQYLDYNLFNHFIIFFWKTFCRLLCYQSFHSRRSHSFTVFCMTYMSTH